MRKTHAAVVAAKGIDRASFAWFWPDGAGVCLTMTHDVETKADGPPLGTRVTSSSLIISVLTTQWWRTGSSAI